MVYVICPVCDRRVSLAEIPAQLPVLVPDHAEGGGDAPICSGGGRKGSEVWMARPQTARVG
jgi:hypothetical protein